MCPNTSFQLSTDYGWGPEKTCDTNINIHEGARKSRLKFYVVIYITIMTYREANRSDSITDKGLQNLANYLLGNMINLKSLSLEFSL